MKTLDHCQPTTAEELMTPNLVSISQTSNIRQAAAFECAWSDWQILEGGPSRDDEVCDHMWVTPPLVGPETPLTESVRVRVDESARLEPIPTRQTGGKSGEAGNP